MRLPPDTHVLAWWLLHDPHLSPRALDLIADANNEVLVSAVSAFEAATKYRIGKWNGIRDLVNRFDAAVEAEGFEVLDISSRHASLAGLMDGFHGDPFDRIIAAQAKLEGLLLITGDKAFRQLDIQTAW